MAEPAVAAPAPDRRAAALGALADQVATAVRLIADDPSPAVTGALAAAGAALLAAAGSTAQPDPARAALGRLLDGAASTGDEELLGLPLAGSRVVVVRHERVEVVTAAAATLGGDRDLLVTIHGGAAVGLARDVPRRAGEDKGRRTATRLASLVVRQHPGARVGVSGPVQVPADLAAARRDAGDAAELAAARGAGWACADDLWGDIVIGRLRALAGSCLTVSHPLRELAAYDRRHGSSLAQTVATWLQRQGDTIRTAEQLALHPNTLRYRLRRSQEVSGLDLSDPAQALVAQLVLEAPARP